MQCAHHWHKPSSKQAVWIHRKRTEKWEGGREDQAYFDTVHPLTNVEVRLLCRHIIHDDDTVSLSEVLLGDTAEPAHKFQSGLPSPHCTHFTLDSTQVGQQGRGQSLCDLCVSGHNTGQSAVWSVCQWAYYRTVQTGLILFVPSQA